MTKALLLMVLAGCVGVSNSNTAEIYKKEVQLEINGVNFEGIATVKETRRFHIGMSLPTKPDLLKITTCHRQLVFKNVGKYFEYDFEPVRREQDLPCSMEIVALDKTGENLWGLINFVGPDERLEAEIGCNGQASKAIGSSLCQARAGLSQTISFKGIVRGVSGEGCPKLSVSNGTYFEYTITRNTCQYVFTDGIEFFRLMTFGYTEVLIL